MSGSRSQDKRLVVFSACGLAAWLSLCGSVAAQRQEAGPETLQEIGIDDRFRSVGGDSMLAVLVHLALHWGYIRSRLKGGGGSAG
mgnify:CR=1 FL=1